MQTALWEELIQANSFTFFAHPQTGETPESEDSRGLSSRGVSGVAKGKEGHWDRAKMGVGVHFNLATLLPPSCGRRLAVFVEGGRHSPGFWPTW